MKNFSLENKLILITGASSGIGRASAVEFSKYNMKIALTARSIEKLKDLKNIINLHNEQVEIFPFDLYNKENILDLIQKIEKKFSQSIDILLNCAGNAVLGNVENVPMHAYQKNLDLNFLAPLALTQNVLIKMKEKNSGQLIYLFSGVGKRGLPGVSPYCATKSALDSFTESLRIEVLKHNIDVILISPGLVKTEFKKRIKVYGKLNETFTSGKEKDSSFVAKQIVNASLKRKRSIILSPKTRLGVFMSFFFPSLVDKFLAKKISNVHN